MYSFRKSGFERVMILALHCASSVQNTVWIYIYQMAGISSRNI
nr:MAG TPA: hypothetical protein [Caudoviricetes sp.]